MRLNLVHEGAAELNYEIRQIAEFGRQLQATGMDMVWENIGDPVAKGEDVPLWIRKKVADLCRNDPKVYSYAPTQGLAACRRFLVKRRLVETGRELDLDDIVFFNGLGDAVSKLYTQLPPSVRILGPSPAYPTHSSAEAAHAGSFHLTYQLDPRNGWRPDVQDIENKVRYNPSIGGILIINPDNPTGMVYPLETLKSIVGIAKRHRLFIIADEIYAELAYGAEPFVPLMSVVDEVPAIIMRGLSKEVPWPGARCGWIEACNRSADENFSRYVQSIIDAKMLEVGSTTLPQAVLPLILGDARYRRELVARRARFQARAEQAEAILGVVDGVNLVRPSGAFYLTVTLDKRALSTSQYLPPANDAAATLLDQVLITPAAPDKRFCYYLMAATGICVVPLSGFNTDLPGFRMTLLETDDQVFKSTLNKLSRAINEYLLSGTTTHYSSKRQSIQTVATKLRPHEPNL